MIRLSCRLQLFNRDHPGPCACMTTTGHRKFTDPDPEDKKIQTIRYRVARFETLAIVGPDSRFRDRKSPGIPGNFSCMECRGVRIPVVGPEETGDTRDFRAWSSYSGPEMSKRRDPVTGNIPAQSDLVCSGAHSRVWTDYPGAVFPFKVKNG